MASRNKNWVAEFSAKYGVSAQIVKSDDKTISVAIIGGKKINGLGQMNKTQTETLFKNISKGIENTLVNNTTVGENTVYLNGNKYNIIDVIKGISINKLIEIMDNSKRSHVYYGIGKWLLDAENRSRYISTLNYNKNTLGNLFYDSGVLVTYLNTGKREPEQPRGELARAIIDEMKVHVLGGK